MKKEKIYLILTSVFTLLTFIAVAYILAKEGKVNSGYSLIPCLFSILFSQLFIKQRVKNNKINKNQIIKHKKITKIIIIIIVIFLILNIVSMLILKENESNNPYIEVKNNSKQEITNSIIVDGIEESYTIYYYGIKSATINLDNQKHDLGEALSLGKITIDEIINELKIYGELNDGGTMIYKDGGTKKYLTDNYTIIKCNTLNGNKDIYIGNEDMEYEESFCK